MSAHSTFPAQRFLGDSRGNVAMLFGLVLVPLLGVVGSAVDYSRAAKVRQDLQSVIDNAALAAASEFSKSGSATSASARLRKFVDEGLAKDGRSLLPAPQPGQSPPQLGGDSSKVLLEGGDFDAATASVRPKLSTRIDTTILAVIGQPYFEVQVSTRSGLAGKKLELSMMLDITGSMCDWSNSCSSARKLDAMKTAANDLVGIVFTGNGTNTRVAVIPFSSAVNVGSFAAAATGEPATQSYTYKCGEFNQSNCTGTKYRTDCVTERGAAHEFTDSPPSPGDYSAAVFSTNPSATCTPGAEASILPLTNTRTAIETKIAGLQAGGSTAGHLGTAWAWYAISDKWAAFWGTESAPEPVAPTVMKAAVLMTDGEYNTCNGSMGCTTSAEDAIALCTNMKAQGIRVFTVGFEIDVQSARDTLIACASPGDYHFPYNGDDMREAFRSIGNALVAGAAGPVLSN